MLEVRSVEETIKIIESHFAGYPVDTENAGVTEALGRVLADDILVPEDVPGFNRSSMDGYAVVAADTFGAGDSAPIPLKLTGEVNMGKKPGFSIAPGQAAYIPTGGELPGNADAVVMIEYTEDLGDGYIYINKSVSPGNNIVFKGDDFKRGNVAVKAGTRLRPLEIGALAAVGMKRVPVKRKLKVGIISTGDEVVDISANPVGGQVRDINAYSLAAGVVSCGALPVIFGIVRDKYDEIRDITSKALNECDIILISGGSSAGARDETCNVIQALGHPGVLVHGIAVKPGKPTIIGKINDKAVIGLPGHPVSAYMIFRIFVCRLMDVMSGTEGRQNGRLKAYTGLNIPSNHGREEFVPVKLTNVRGRPEAYPVFGKSGLISVLSSAGGYIHIGRGTEGVKKGEEVEVYLF